MALTAVDPRRQRPLVRAWHVASVVYQRTGKDNLGVVAAGCAFYALLALFPFLAALISIFGLLADPMEVRQQLEIIQGTVPDQVHDILDRQVQQLSAQETSLSVGLILSTAIALYSSTTGVKAIMQALNIVYDETEHRNVIVRNLVALGLTAGFALGITAALLVVVVVPVVLGLLGLSGGIAGSLVDLARWTILAAGLFAALAVIYRIAPNRRPIRFRWLSWGSVVAAVLWLAASMLFSYYVANFASYNETYGSLGAVVVLLVWFFIGAYAVLIGGAINAELERGPRPGSTA